VPGKWRARRINQHTVLVAELAPDRDLRPRRARGRPAPVVPLRDGINWRQAGGGSGGIAHGLRWAQPPCKHGRMPPPPPHCVPGTSAHTRVRVKMIKNWLRSPYDSKALRSHYLHPHPYTGPRLPPRAAAASHRLRQADRRTHCSEGRVEIPGCRQPAELDAAPCGRKRPTRDEGCACSPHHDGKRRRGNVGESQSVMIKWTHWCSTCHVYAPLPVRKLCSKISTV
jgi:hypothetical protein